MTVRYVEVTSSDLQPELSLARAQPRHPVLWPKAPRSRHAPALMWEASVPHFAITGAEETVLCMFARRFPLTEAGRSG